MCTWEFKVKFGKFSDDLPSDGVLVRECTHDDLGTALGL